jgi:hypothetical protein
MHWISASSAHMRTLVMICTALCYTAPAIKISRENGTAAAKNYQNRYNGINWTMASFVTGMCWESESAAYLIHCVKGTKDLLQLDNKLRFLLFPFPGKWCEFLGFHDFSYYSFQGSPLPPTCPDALFPGLCAYLNDFGFNRTVGLINKGGGIDDFMSDVVATTGGADSLCSQGDLSKRSIWWF